MLTVSRSLTLLCACALAAAFMPSLAAAAPPKKAPSPYLTQINELHTVKVMLERADRDYKGHRATAVKELTAAIQALEAGFKHVAFPKLIGKAVEPQRLSDKQLNDAIAKLQLINTQIKGATAQAATASANIISAIAELKVALTIK